MTFGFNMELNFKFNPFDYVAIEKTSSKMRGTCFKMQNGDQDVKKTIMLTIGGCVAFIAMSEALPLFFK